MGDLIRGNFPWVLPAVQRKNKGSCIFQHRGYNTILEFWQQQAAAGILQKSGNSEAILTCSMGSTLHPVWWEGCSVCSTPQQRQGWGRESRKESGMCRCFIPSDSKQTAWKEARKVVFEQWGPVKAAFVIFHLLRERKQRTCKKEGWTEWCQAG